MKKKQRPARDQPLLSGENRLWTLTLLPRGLPWGLSNLRIARLQLLGELLGMLQMLLRFRLSSLDDFLKLALRLLADDL